MRRRRTSRALAAAFGVTALAGLGVGAGPSGLVAQAATHHPAGLTSSAPVTVVASGLDNPRNLIWGPHGQLLVSEDGTVPTTCVNKQCYGLDGSIDDISSGTPVPIATGLATYIDNGEVVGPAGMAWEHGQLYTVITHTPLPAVEPGIPVGMSLILAKQLGYVLDVNHGHVSEFANPGAVNYAWADAHQSVNPGQFPDSNPYDLVPKPGGGFYLVDAATNVLNSVSRSGQVSVLAYVPNPPSSDAVPTCLAMGPGGDVYIGELTGFGNSATQANVYRYDPRDGSLTVWQSGFSSISGCGFGANGDFYVTQLDNTGNPPVDNNITGEVVQISPDGTRTVLGLGKLFAPVGFLAGPDGSIYVVNYCVFDTADPQSGEVVKIG